MNTMKSVGISGMLMGYKAGLLHGGSIEGEQGLKDLRELSEYIEQLQAENEKLKEALEHIIEYWNGSDNYRATADALEEIIETARQALKGGDKL